MHESDEFFFRALEAGAAGYIVKKAAMDDLVSGVRAVARGDAILYPSMAKKLIRWVRPGVLEVLARAFCWQMAFRALDFPALERPAKATS